MTTLYKAALPEHAASDRTGGKDFFAASITGASYWTSLAGYGLWEIWAYEVPADAPVTLYASSWGAGVDMVGGTLGDINLSEITDEGEIVLPYAPRMGECVAIVERSPEGERILCADGKEIQFLG